MMNRNLIQSAIMEAIALVVETKSKAGREARGIWYHGTQPKNLKSIMSQGLSATWKDKNWAKDDEASRITVDRTAYGGIYVTKNLMTALSSTTQGKSKGSYKDGNLIVIMDLQPKSLAADEDSFARWMADVPMEGMRWGGMAASILWFSMMKMDIPDEIDIEAMSREEYNSYARSRDNRRTYNETWEAYQKRFYENYRIFNNNPTVSPQQKKAAEPALREAYHAAIERMAGYFPEEYGKWWKSDWHRQYSVVDPNAKQDEVPDPPDPKEGEAKFRKAVDKITKIFTAPVTVKQGSFITARSLSDIKFAGSNRIIAIIEVNTNKRGPHKLIVHYGTPPADFFQQWDERWGSKLYVVDRNGKRQPQYDHYKTVIQELEDKVEESTNPKNSLISGLRAEARKYKTFEEFKRAFLVEIKHGVYWHVTADKDFKINSEKGPRDMSSMAKGVVSKGKLMVTSHLENWLDFYNEKDRPYVALIDMSEVPADKYWQINRGFGNEFFVEDPSKAKVVAVMTRDEAMGYDSKIDEQKPQNQKELRAIWEKEHGINEVFSVFVEGQGQGTRRNIKHIGWKIVASDGKDGAVSLYDKKVPVSIKVGSVTKNTYLGNSPEYVNMFFRASTDPEDAQDILLKFEYDDSDLIQGDPDFKNGEVQVKKANLISVHPLPRLADDGDGNDIRRHIVSEALVGSLRNQGYSPSVIRWLSSLKKPKLIDSPLDEYAAYFGVKTSSTIEQVLKSMPMSWIEEGGVRIHLICQNGELVVLIEDWLSGCIPNDMEYGDRETEDYCLMKGAQLGDRVEAKLGPGWISVLDVNEPEDRVIRYAWKKKDGLSESSDSSIPKYVSPYSDLMKPKGESESIGREAGKFNERGISKFTSPHGSYRYVKAIDGNIIGVLQIVSHDRKNGIIANVFVKSEHRRHGVASELLERAKKDFEKINHSSDLSDMGKSWRQSLKENYETAIPYPKKRIVTKLDGVDLKLYHVKDTLYIEWIFVPQEGMGQKTIEKLRKQYKVSEVIAIDPIKSSRGFWEKMLERGIIDDIMHGVPSYEKAGEQVLISDDEYQSTNDYYDEDDNNELPSWMNENIESHEQGDTMWLDLIEVPKSQQRKGLGRKEYEEWEGSLPKNIKLVKLMAADMGDGNSQGFWERMGFDFVYTSNDPNNIPYEYRQEMQKGVNGHPTPNPIDWEEYTESSSQKRWGPGDKPYLNNPDLADIKSPKVNFRGPMPGDPTKAVVVMDGIQMTVPMAWLSEKPQCENAKQDHEKNDSSPRCFGEVATLAPVRGGGGNDVDVPEDEGDDDDDEDDDPDELLKKSAASGDLKGVKKALALGAEYNKPHKVELGPGNWKSHDKGGNALCSAIGGGHHSVVDYLLKYGVRMKHPNYFMCASRITEKDEIFDMFQTLLDNGLKPGDEYMDVLIDYCSSVNQFHDFHLEGIEWLIKKAGSNPNAHNPSFPNVTPLTKALGSQGQTPWIAAVEKLLDLGAKPNKAFFDNLKGILRIGEGKIPAVDALKKMLLTRGIIEDESAKNESHLQEAEYVHDVPNHGKLTFEDKDALPFTIINDEFIVYKNKDDDDYYDTNKYHNAILRNVMGAANISESIDEFKRNVNSLGLIMIGSPSKKTYKMLKDIEESNIRNSFKIDIRNSFKIDDGRFWIGANILSFWGRDLSSNPLVKKFLKDVNADTSKTMVGHSGAREYSDFKKLGSRTPVKSDEEQKRADAAAKLMKAAHIQNSPALRKYARKLMGEGTVKPGVKQALVLVHVDSLDSYASQGGSIDIGEGWKYAMSKFDGDTIVVSQGWHKKGGAFSRDAMNMVRDIVGSADHVIEFDETEQAWGPFLKKLDTLLKKLGVTSVDVGGIWYDPQGQTGCATEVIQSLEKKGYQVTPRIELLGSDEDLENQEDDELKEAASISIGRNKEKRAKAEAAFKEIKDASFVFEHFLVFEGGNVFVELSVFNDRLHLSGIMANEKKKGFGAKVMRFLMDVADKHGVEIEGTAKPFSKEGMKKTALKAWYKKLGFDFKGDNMIRKPILKEEYNPDEDMTGSYGGSEEEESRIELTCLDNESAPERTPETKEQWGKAAEIGKKHGVAYRFEENTVTGYGDAYMYPSLKKLEAILQDLEDAEVGFDNIDLPDDVDSKLVSRLKKKYSIGVDVNPGQFP